MPVLDWRLEKEPAWSLQVSLKHVPQPSDGRFATMGLPDCTEAAAPNGHVV